MSQAPSPIARSGAGRAERAPRPSRRSLSDWTRERLYGYLLDGHWAPGHVVNEVTVTEELGVSRSPIRESLAELERDELLVRSPQDGRRHVIAFSLEDVTEIYDLRISLECLAVRYLAPVVSDEVLEELETLLAEMSTVAPGGTGRQRSFAADFEFHQLLARESGHPRLLGILRRVWMQSRVLLADLNRRAVYPDSIEMGRVVHEHGSVLEALRSRDADTAEAALHAHLTGAKQRVVAAFLAAEEVREEDQDDDP